MIVDYIPKDLFMLKISVYEEEMIIQPNSSNIKIPYRRICIENEQHIDNSNNRLSNNKINDEYISIEDMYYLNSINSNNNENKKSTNIKINFNDKMIVCHHSNLDKYRDKILSTYCNYCVIFQLDTLIKEMIVSYSPDNQFKHLTDEIKQNILKQIELDFPRMEIYINSIKCCYVEHLLSWFSKFQNYQHYLVGNIYQLLILLCTQTSFFYSFSTLYQIYYNPGSNIHIIPITDYPIINIVDNITTIDLYYKKFYKYLDIISEEIIYKIYTYMHFSIDLMYNTKTNSTAVVYWTLEKNK